MEQVVGRPRLLHAASVHHDDPVRYLEGLVLIVGDEHAGQLDLIVELAEPGAQLLAHLGVERAERLVEE